MRFSNCQRIWIARSTLRSRPSILRTTPVSKGVWVFGLISARFFIFDTQRELGYSEPAFGLLTQFQD